MIFVETPVFTRALKRALSDEDYRALQWSLVLRPTQGNLIRGGGGLRKVRWRTAQDDLTPDQLRVLSRLVREERK